MPLIICKILQCIYLNILFCLITLIPQNNKFSCYGANQVSLGLISIMGYLGITWGNFLVTFPSEIIWSLNIFNIKQLLKKEGRQFAVSLQSFNFRRQRKLKCQKNFDENVSRTFHEFIVSRSQKAKSASYFLQVALETIMTITVGAIFVEIQCSFKSSHPEVNTYTWIAFLKKVAGWGLATYLK